MTLSDSETEAIIKAIESVNNIDIKDDIIHQKLEEYGHDINGVMKLIDEIFVDDPHFETYLHITPE